MAKLWFAPKAKLVVSQFITVSGSAALYGQQKISQVTEDTTITIGKSTLAAGDDVLNLGQSFTALSSKVDRVVFKVFKVNTPTDGLNAIIYEEDGSDLPTGTAIATSTTVAAADIATSPGGEEVFDFTSSTFTMPLVVGKKYVVTLQRTDTQSDTNYYSARYKGTASSYSGGVLSRSDNGSTYTATSTDDAYFEVWSGDYASETKDVKISGGERDAESLKLLGYNELLEEKRASIVEATFTRAYQDKQIMEMLNGAPQLVTGNYYRVIGGEKASNDRGKKSVLFRLYDGTNTVNVMLNNALITSKDLNLAADGSAEESVTAKCLASDYIEEDDYA